MTNNKQQTAVDILCGKLAMKLGIPQAITFYIDHQEEIREAKEMHKEEMVMFVLKIRPMQIPHFCAKSSACYIWLTATAIK